nr:MAG TPA: hypothetical protein [Caudoviricetes sp.]
MLAFPLPIVLPKLPGINSRSQKFIPVSGNIFRYNYAQSP